MAEKKPENPLRAGLRTPLSKASTTLVGFEEALRIAGQEMQDRLPYLLNELVAISPAGLPFLNTYQYPVYHTDEACLEALADEIHQFRAMVDNLHASARISPETCAALKQAAADFDALERAGRQTVRERKELRAAALLVETLESLKDNPVIQDAPWVSDFVATLAAEIGRSTEPHEVIASIAKTTGATKAASIRHAPSVEIQIRVVKEWDRLKSADQHLTKNKAAEDIALDAVDWNDELGGKIKSLTTYGTAVPAVRKWLQNGNMEKIRVLMRA